MILNLQAYPEENSTSSQQLANDTQQSDRLATDTQSKTFKPFKFQVVATQICLDMLIFFFGEKMIQFD